MKRNNFFKNWTHMLENNNPKIKEHFLRFNSRNNKTNINFIL